jgi:uncharacterized membrane protein YraQ (UPF0718 family)
MVEKTLRTENTSRQLTLALSHVSTLAKDPVSWALILLTGLIGLLDRNQVLFSWVFTFESLWQMLPFFALAIGIAAYAKASSADNLIAGVFLGNPVRATVLAAFVGALSPFCSCGVIPLIAAMLGAGVPLAPVMAFWIASPIMDPEMFILTAAGIGLNFTIAKTIAAIGMGLFSGLAVLMLQKQGFLDNPLRPHVSSGCGSSCNSEPQASAGTAGMNWRFWQDTERMKIFIDEAISIGVFLGKWLTLAFFLESLMLAYVSSEWIVSYVGADNPFAIPVAALVGAPSYLNGYAAIPLVSGLLEMGMTPGAAMAFITAGAVSSIPAAIAVFALVKKSVFVLYLSLGLVGAMFSAWVFQWANAYI